jgi:dCMP deaminase
MSKPKDKVFLLMAEQLAELSTCDRMAVGAIITLAGRAVSWGYNGAPPGAPHCSENNHGWGDYSGVDVSHSGCRNSIHAELNAVAFAARQGISTEGGTLYVSVAPCLNCAYALLSSGIIRVVYQTKYRDETGLSILLQAGVELTQHG